MGGAWAVTSPELVGGGSAEGLTEPGLMGSSSQQREVQRSRTVSGRGKHYCDAEIPPQVENRDLMGRHGVSALTSFPVSPATFSLPSPHPEL